METSKTLKKETNVRLKLTIVDTVGFGDQVNKENSYRPIVDYIDQQFEAYLQEELKVKRNLHDYNDRLIFAISNWFWNSFVAVFTPVSTLSHQLVTL